MSLFRHIDGRIMKRTPAGGTGGGITSHFDELATAEDAAEFERGEMVVEAVAAEPEAYSDPHPEPEHHEPDQNT